MKFDIVIKSILDRRSGRELRFRPDFQNGRRQNMRRRMAQAFDVGHRCALFGSFAFVHFNSERFLDFARNDKDFVGWDEFGNG